MSTAPAPVLYLSHGSPMRVLEDTPARDFLSNLPSSLPEVNGIVVVSAHWETDGLYYTQDTHLETIHDFGGFPDALYQIHYPAQSPGWLQRALTEQLSDSGIRVSGDNRGLDHGAWSVLCLMYPDAGIPVVGLSLPSATLRSLHALGQALKPLRLQGVMIMTTGMPTHNLGEFRRDGGRKEQWATEFVDWLQDKVANQDLAALFDYQSVAPNARRAHPTDEHLRPLFIALGAAEGEPPSLIHDSWELGNGNNSSWAWGLPNRPKAE